MRRHQPPAERSSFAACAPGHEPILLAELQALGLKRPKAEAGGVGFDGGLESVMRANLWLRTASRVLVRAAQFHASTFHELERRAAQVPWERWVAPGAPVRFRVTCRKSKLYHSDAVAQRLMRSIDMRLGKTPAVAADPGDEDEAGESAGQLFVVRLAHDECTISADASGALLHRRGYRQAVAKAPLRETLAAAVLLGSGWTPAEPLMDPMCGAGTIAIEAALLARRMAPGLGRSFAFERWPDFAASSWARIQEAARAEALPSAPAPILAADRDAGAITATLANAERAGVLADLTVERRALSALATYPPSGWIVTNPPYGVRVGDRGPLRDLYARLGDVAGHTGWSLALLVADRMLAGQLQLPLAERWRSTNGGIPISLVVFEAPGRATPPGATDGDPMLEGAEAAAARLAPDGTGL